MKELIKVECENCKKNFEYNLNWREVEGESISDEERGMGDEKVHHCYVNEFKCPNCDCNNIINVVDVYEYPDGGFNYAIGRHED